MSFQLSHSHLRVGKTYRNQQYPTRQPHPAPRSPNFRFEIADPSTKSDYLYRARRVTNIKFLNAWVPTLHCTLNTKRPKKTLNYQLLKKP
jgi:hypothetical protein